MKTAVVLTARCGSERFPGKMLADVRGKPLVAVVLERLLALEKGCAKGRIILATTNRIEDSPLAVIAREMGVPVFCGDQEDVVRRVDQAVRVYAPDAKFVLRALGDCPFLATNLVDRAVYVMEERDADAFVWNLAPTTWPVYGSREFPFSRRGWDVIAKEAAGRQRQHVDMFFHENRQNFKIAYHEAPPLAYFRPYRLEVDWPEDLEVIRRVFQALGDRPPLLDVLDFLDDNPDVAAINRKRVEKTGPTVSYTYRTHRGWMKLMRGEEIVGWDGRVWRPVHGDAQPIFCNSGRCFIGFAWRGVLYQGEARISGTAFITCPCGSGRAWQEVTE